nr:hypothetical protein [Cellulosimicrobium sp. MM]
MSPGQPRHVRPAGAGRGSRPGTTRDAVPRIEGALPGDPAAAGTPDETAEAGATEAPAPRTGSLGRSSALMASGTFVSRGLASCATSAGRRDRHDGLVRTRSTSQQDPQRPLRDPRGRVLNAVLVPQIVRAYRARNTQDG